jgi:para-nitrobenzyl esterase
VDAFLGVPYAAPPVGSLRFRAPAPAPSWVGERNAAVGAEACMQVDRAGRATGSEDCLALNVWTPHSRRGSAIPVLVFIHGGAFVSGSAIPRPFAPYDGAHLAARGLVVVILQYRLGALGFLAHPALTAENAPPSSGNLGILDQLAALRWVQRNVGAFGGDPARVTVMGESAGADSIAMLLASPHATGLFARALLESAHFELGTLANAEHRGALVARAVGCVAAADVARCLRACDAARLVTAVPGESGVSGALASHPFYYAPNVDGDVVRQSPLAAFEQGMQLRVPIIVGTNADETAAQVRELRPRVTDAEAYRAALVRMYGAGADAILARYPPPIGSAIEATLTRVTTDQRWVCPTRRALRALARTHAPAAVRAYVFAHAFENDRAWHAWGAFHGAELLYVFHAIAVRNYTPTAHELALADDVESLWARYAATGDPNPAGTDAWPRYELGDERSYVIDELSHADRDARTDACDLWDSLQRQ